MKVILIISISVLFDFTASICQETLSIAEQAIVDYHNRLRQLHKDTPDLCYGMSDSTHTFFPQKWSEFLLPRGPKNAGHSNEDTNLGENIEWFPDIGLWPSEDYLRGIKHWYDEIFQYLSTKRNKKNRNKTIGHVTQMVWKDTKEVRCGRAAGSDKEGVFIVCHYWPRGNIGTLLSTEVRPFKNESYAEMPELSQEIFDELLEAAKNQVVRKHAEVEKVKAELKHPEELEHDDTDITVIVLASILPCLGLFGLVVCCQVKRGRKIRVGSYRPVSQNEDEKTMRLLLIAAVASFVHFTAAKCQKNLSTAERSILDFHNKLRQLHQNTPDLCYGESDSTHIFFPQEWSEFLFERGADNIHHSTSVTANNIGENIAWNPNLRSNQSVDYLRSIKRWYDNIFRYDFERGDKGIKNERIGHATQIIWKDTKEIRCGRTAASTGLEGVFIVCQYWPRGNNEKLLATDVNPFKDTNVMNDPKIKDISETVMNGILEKVLAEKKPDLTEDNEKHKKYGSKKLPAEIEKNESEITFIVLGATLPCIALLGIAFFCNVKRNQRSQYEHVSLLDDGQR
ncbi:hypothetical protein ACHWQZ_G019010 [Mnemiopsis leidyi]